MQHKLLALLFCVIFGAIAVHGQWGQLRFMNARFSSSQTVDITTDPYNITTTAAVSGRFSVPDPTFPVSNYVELPTASMPFYTNITFYAYDKDNFNVPIVALAEVWIVTTLQPYQSYSLVYVDRTEDVGEPTANVPPQLLYFTEVSGNWFSSLKIVNVAVSTYQSSDLWITSDRGDSWSVPYGGDTGFTGVNGGNITFTVHFTDFNYTFVVPLHELNTVVYIRGDYGASAQFGYNVVTNSIGTAPPVVAPYFEPLPPTPTSAPSAPRSVALIKFINTYQFGDSLTLTIYDQNGYPRYNVSAYSVSDYISVYDGLNNYLNMEVRDAWGNPYTSSSFYVQDSVNYTVYFNGDYGLKMLRDVPQNYNQTASYLRIVNNVPGQTFIQLLLPAINWSWNSYYGELWYEEFIELYSGYGEIYLSGNMTASSGFYLYPGVATTIYLIRDGGNIIFYTDDRALPAPIGPVCVNGYVESNGVCNCYSGYSTDNYSPYKCNNAAPYYCFANQTDPLSNDYVPYIPYWNTQVYGNQLYFSVYSNIVANRRTLIELPNPQCSFINSPQYYQKYNDGCQDRIDVNVPFTDCGFVKTSTSSEDVYKGTVHVKQIDRVTVAGTTYDRVIDTPMPISIRMPKTLAIQSSVQVFGPASLAIDAAFVGQTVSTESQSGNLQYVSAVQYPLQIETVQLVDLPYGVNAWIEVVNVNCSGVGPCVQRLEVHLNTTSCSISGVYRMVVSLSCRTDQGCPDEAKNGTQVYIESRIVSQSLCGEVSVDIDLNGYIQAYTDQNFTNPALAFYPGQSAYFLVSAFSSRVSLSRVSIESVYYYGPNVNYQYLSYNTSLSYIALANNFTTGTQGSSQAWFGLDVSVSTPNSGDNSTLFKLYQGQNGVYNFVAVVDVEWYVANAPVGAPTTMPYAYQPTSAQPYPGGTPSATPPSAPTMPYAYQPTSAQPYPGGTPTAAPTATPTVASAPTVQPISAQPTSAPITPPFKKRMILQGAVSNQGSQFTAQVQVAGPTPSAPQQPPQQQQQTPVAANPGTTDNKPVSSGVSLSSSLFFMGVMALVTLF